MPHAERVSKNTFVCAFALTRMAKSEKEDVLSEKSTEVFIPTKR